MIAEKEGPNDGLVSVDSSKWVSGGGDIMHVRSNTRQGTYLGTLVDVNHLDLVGWINTARYKWAEIMGKEIKFRPATFYLGIADRLAREVEGLGEGQEPAEEESSRDASPDKGDSSAATLGDFVEDSGRGRTA